MLIVISQFPNHSLKCLSAKMNNGNVKMTKTKTILHDLYEKQRQSPYYDNLCRPVSDLVPFISSGIRGVTTNPAVFFSFFPYLCLLSWKHHDFAFHFFSYQPCTMIMFSCCRYLKKLYHHRILTISSWGLFFCFHEFSLEKLVRSNINLIFGLAGIW